MILLLDASNLAYRAMFTLDLTHRGKDVSILYGTLNMIAALLRKYHARYVIACFDYGISTFRRGILPQYKAHRKKDESRDWESIYAQMDELCNDILPMHGIMVIRQRNIEADDFLAQAALLSSDRPYIVSTDNDLLQCVSNRVSVLNPIKGKIYDLDSFEQEFGFPPEYYLLYKIFLGDSSDGVQGVKGIGPKTATKIIKELMRTPDALPYNYKYMCKFSGKILSSRLHTSLVKYGESAWHTAYAVMNLMPDYCDTRRIILNTGWTAAVANDIKKFYMHNAFTSLLEGETIRLFTALERPPTSVSSSVKCPLIYHDKHPPKGVVR